MTYEGFIPPYQLGQHSTLRVVMLGEFAKYIFLRKLLGGSNAPYRDASVDLLIDRMPVNNTVEIVTHTVSGQHLKIYIVGSNVDNRATATYTDTCHIQLFFAQGGMLHVTSNTQTAEGTVIPGNREQLFNQLHDNYNDADIIMRNILSSYLCGHALRTQTSRPAHTRWSVLNRWLMRFWRMVLCRAVA